MNEREDYLDRLLRGMDEESDNNETEEDFFSSLGGTVSQEAEDDFLKEFEKSRAQWNDTSKEEQDFDADDVDQIVSNVKNGILEDMEEYGGLEDYGSLDDGTDLSIEESLQNYTEKDEGLDEIGNGYKDDDAGIMVNTMDQEEQGQETDYTSGEANQELLDMLSGIGEDDGPQTGDSQSEFSLLGDDPLTGDEGEASFQDSLDDLEPSDTSQPAAGESAAESLARQLENLGLDLEEEDDSQKEEAAKKKKDKKKNKKASAKEQEKGEKQGFFQRLSKLLFDGEELIELSEEETKKVKEEESKKAAEAAEAKERKKQEQQEKKEQKKQENAEKKAQKEARKQEKAKKKQEKKETMVIEKTKPLPKGPVFLIIMLGLSLVLLINLLTSQTGYSLSIAQAKEYYEQGEYVEAYACFDQGTKVRKADEELYNKARLTAYLQQPLYSYQVYRKQKMHQEALNALILGVGRYDKNAYEAASSGAAVEYDNMLAKIEKALKKKYKMTLDQARELYKIREKEEYTLELYKVIEELGLE
ncbi:hypothetical protein D3Z36_13995 [Lachnospiraceae bacterium]|nr:hypothetical protein [Lachnospiraceae bacterium]